MDKRIPSSIKKALAERKDNASLRVLKPENGLLDFASNDYLGLSQNAELFSRIKSRIAGEGQIPMGGTGSRLISGNHDYYQELETLLKEVFRSEAVLVFNSGYAANQALVSAVPQKGDTILYDQLAHVCLKEGAWLSKAESFAFLHNDIKDLDRRLKKAKGTAYVVTETIFSMDGDVAPLKEIAHLCKEHGAFLIVDEAHSTGTHGSQGGGWLIEKELEESVFGRVYTFGKAMGIHGACICGSRELIDFLVNYGRPFIYTTSMPPHTVISIAESFRFLGENEVLQKTLRKRIERFRKQVPESVSNTAIQPISIPGNTKCKEVSLKLQESGFDVRPILAPTVKVGTERLRVSLHAHNDESHIDSLASLINQLL